MKQSTVVVVGKHLGQVSVFDGHVVIYVGFFFCFFSFTYSDSAAELHWLKTACDVANESGDGKNHVSVNDCLLVSQYTIYI